jgi:hypothetical protein
MATKEKENAFDYTTGATWGGTQLSPTALKVASVMGGFVGADHLLLRSPGTAALKCLVNFFTLGFWYFYDLIQVFGDQTELQAKGYSLPCVGPAGIGAGLLHKEGVPTAPKTSPSPYMFAIYVLMILVPFGVSHFIAGDLYGGAAKFFLTFNPFTFLLAFVWAAYSAYAIIVTPKTIVQKGTDRFFPATLFMDPYGFSENLQLYRPAPPAGQNTGLISGVIMAFFGPFLKIVEPLLGPFIQPVLLPAVGAAQAAQLTAKTALATAESVKGAIEGTLPPALAAASAVTALAKTVPDIAQGVTESVSAFTKPEVLADLAAKAAANQLQKGGAIDVGVDSSSTYLFFGVATAILIGSIGVTYMRSQGPPLNRAAKEEKNDVPPPKGNTASDDSPSGPRVL